MPIWLIVLIAVYVAGFLIFSRGTTFYNERGSDKFVAGLVWPLILAFMLWKLWVGPATLSWTSPRGKKHTYHRSRR